MHDDIVLDVWYAERGPKHNGLVMVDDFVSHLTCNNCGIQLTEY